MMWDTTWQLQAIASVAVSIPLGLALRRGLDELDRQRDDRRERRVHHGRREPAAHQ